MQKFAAVESILEVKQTPSRLSFTYDQKAGDRLAKFATLDDMKESDGYLYVRCRAISSRVNKNNDGWPSEELARAYKSFIGRPVFVDHNNDDPKRTRGVIVDSKLHVEDDEKTSKLDPYYSTAPDNHKPPTWIELLIEVDANTFPRLAKSIRSGDIDAVSMGANIDKSVCSVCAHEASTPSDYCDHIKKKGITFEITADNGEKVRKKSYEDCYGVNFFEISFVFDPADTTALISEKVGKVAAGEEGVNLPLGLLDDAWMAIHPGGGEQGIAHALKHGDSETALQHASELAAMPIVHGQENPYYGQDPNDIINQVQQAVQYGVISSFIEKTATTNPVDFFVEPVGTTHDQDDPNYIPQSQQITAPQQVDTLREEYRCPVCKAADMQTDPDGIERCPVCGHVQEPEPLNNPDLGVARDTDLRQDTTDQTDSQGNPEVPVTDGTEQVEFAPMSPVSPVAASFTNKSKGVIGEMFETKLRTESKEEADTLVPAKTGHVEIKLGRSGITKKTTASLAEQKVDAKITFPLVEGAENYVELPKDNPIFAFFLAQESAAKLGKRDLSEVPVIIEAASQVEAEIAAKVIRESAKVKPVKKPLLNSTAKPSDEPKNEKIISDELAPRITSVKQADGVTVETVQVGDKSYKLVPLDEEEEKEEPQASEVEEETDEKPAEEEQSDKSVEDEPQDSAEDKKEEDKEAKLLAAMKIADEAVEMGFVDKEAKMVYIATLEEKDLGTLETLSETLQLQKAAGLSKKGSKLQSLGLRRVPRLAHSVPATSQELIELGNDPEFLLGA